MKKLADHSFPPNSIFTMVATMLGVFLTIALLKDYQWLSLVSCIVVIALGIRSIYRTYLNAPRIYFDSNHVFILNRKGEPTRQIPYRKINTIENGDANIRIWGEQSHQLNIGFLNEAHVQESIQFFCDFSSDNFLEFKALMLEKASISSENR